MDWVKLTSIPFGCVQEWAWDPLRTIPMRVVDENTSAIFVDLNEVIRDLERNGKSLEAREWRMYRLDHGNIMRIPRTLVEETTKTS